MKRMANRVFWATHELAWSNRTIGFPLFFLDKDGRALMRFEAEKEGGSVEIPEGAVFLAKYYESNSGYKEVYFYEIPEKMTINDFLSL